MNFEIVQAWGIYEKVYYKEDEVFFHGYLETEEAAKAVITKRPKLHIEPIVLLKPQSGGAFELRTSWPWGSQYASKTLDEVKRANFELHPDLKYLLARNQEAT